jgi:hypothetical protein
MELTLEQAREMKELTDRIVENLHEIERGINDCHVPDLDNLLVKTNRIVSNLNEIWRRNNE